MRVLGISGSLRRDSHNLRLLRAAAAELPPGAELDVYEGLREIPPYDEDLDVEPAPEAVARLRRAVAEADAVLIATPEYNHSIPGQLKNALDWVSRPYATNPMRDKPATAIGASPSMFGAVWAQEEARKVLRAMGARVVDRELPVAHADGAFAQDGRLADDEQRAALAELVGELTGEEARAPLDVAA